MVWFLPKTFFFWILYILLVIESVEWVNELVEYIKSPRFSKSSYIYNRFHIPRRSNHTFNPQKKIKNFPDKKRSDYTGILKDH